MEQLGLGARVTRLAIPSYKTIEQAGEGGLVCTHICTCFQSLDGAVSGRMECDSDSLQAASLNTRLHTRVKRAAIVKVI